MKRCKLFGMTLVLVATMLGGAVGEARAQYARHKGQVLLSEKPVPAKDDEIAAWLRKEVTTTLKSDKAGNVWDFHYVAVLTQAPPVNMVHLVYYEMQGAGFKYINAEDVKVAGAANVLVGKGKMHKLLGFAPGKRYQIRITTRDNRGVERVFARSRAITLR